VRALIVLPQPPSCEGGAAARCAVALLRGLRTHGVDAVALAAHHAFSGNDPVPEDLRVEVVPIERTAPRIWRSPLARAWRPLGDLASPAFAARIDAVAREVDVVHFDQIESACYGPCRNVPSAVHLHYRVRDNPVRGPRQRGELAHRLELALAERRAIARFGWLIANSPLVAQTMRGASTPVTTAPLSIDVPSGMRASLDGPPRLGIIGTASWPPTRAALRRLVDGIWPAVRRRVPRAELHVAGRGTRDLLKGVRAAGIVLAGEVPSASRFLAEMSALIYPAPAGSGMKVKVLESIAIGLPVVTTPAGAEGIEPNDGVLVHADDAGLVASAVAMLANAGERHARGERARATFVQRYTPERATAPLVALYRAMLSPRISS